MKWVSLLKDFKEKVGLTAPAGSSVSSPSSSAAPSPFYNDVSNASSSSNNYFSSSTPRDKYELELDFKRHWEEFRSSSSEKEKEKALNMTVDIFCRFVKQHSNVAQLITMLVETHIFSFVVGRAFVTDIEKLRLGSKTRLLEIESLIGYFSEITEDGIQPGSNLLQAVEYLVSGPIDKQSLLDSGILCCLIYILNALLGSDGKITRQKVTSTEDESGVLDNTGPNRRLEVEGSVVHIMKALASHPAAAQSLIEDNSLQLLFEMVANGSLILFSRYKEGLVPLHNIQLHRHAMQILGLLMTNDNGSTAKYIRRHQLMKVLLTAVKDFKLETGDPAYTMSIVDLLLECIELSYRPEAGDIRLREDVRNAHGYQYLVQFALVLSKDHNFETNESATEDTSSQGLSLTLSRLLDVLVNLSQTGPSDIRLTGSKGNRKSRTSSSERFPDDSWEKDSYKVKDIDAIQVLQDIFLKADSRDLQAEVLNRMFKIFSSHLENYMLCQQLRTVPLLILNMGGFPSSLQEIILKILEYAVTVVNCIPEQELLALCCLLQQQITSELKHTILSFFIKLLSFDQQYKKVLREVGVLEVLLDDLKQHKFVLGSEQDNGNYGDDLERQSNSSSFKKHLDNKDAIISSPKLLDSSSGKFSLFETESTISVAWDCLFYLLKKAEQNQVTYRSANGVNAALPFLVSDIHRPGVLRVLSCLIIEDSAQVHSEELSTLVEISKSGMVTSALGSQYDLQINAKCDVFGAIWRVLGANTSAQRVFGEATGFSLLLTTLHSFQNDKAQIEPSFLPVCMKVFTYLLRVTTAGVCNNAVNREKLNTILSSHTFYDLLSESGLICVECERQLMQLLLELALEIVIPPFSTPETNDVGNSSASFPIVTQSGPFVPDKERIYNAGALRVLIRSLLLFTPKLQLELLKLIEELACAGPFNQENLTSTGCVELLLETISPFLSGSSSLLSHALKIVEVLGAYRLSAAELRMIIRCLLQVRQRNPGHILVNMIEKIVIMQDTALEKVPLAPFIEMDMRKIGYASIHVSLGERSWPPAAGYSFVCWFQYRNFLKPTVKDTESSKSIFSRRNKTTTGPQVLRIFSVGSADGGDTFYAELRLQDDGTLTLATSNSSSLTFSGLDLNEDQWHHLAVVHSKPNALAGLFQASVAYVYLNGKLRHTGRLGYSPSPAGKSLQVTIGTPITYARVSDMSWTLRSCYLFEEVLTPGSIFFMYILGRGYRGLFQDMNLLQFVPNQACRGGSMAILDSLETDLLLTSNSQRGESGFKQGNPRNDRSGMVWDFERLGNLSLQLLGRKLIFAFDGTSTEAFPASGTLSMLNLVDPLSAAASPIGGIPRFGRLHGDVYVCKHCTIGETVRPIGGIAVVLALIEVAETREMLHMALTLLACALNQNPQNIRDMQAFRGYHLLALFLHSRMSMFDMRSLEIFFQIAACEASFPEPKKLEEIQNNISPSVTVNETTFDELNLTKSRDELSSDGSRDDMDDFSMQKDTFSHMSELDNDIPPETSNCIVLSNADMVEHVLLDWTVWVTAEIPIQITLLGFLENLVSMHWYRNHNLTILRRINLVQHLLVTLQRGDVEVPVLEKLVVLLGVILEDGFVISELEHVVRFVIMTFDPPEPTSRVQITREQMGKHIIVRNMLLEMLIDLLVTITSEELLEQWHKIVSSKLITYFLDEGVHPTSMRWIMTLLGVCLQSSPTFALKFRTSGGYQGLMRVLPSFYDSPDIYYVLFCLIFGKPVYPRLPEVRMLDFHALMPNDGNNVEFKFLELLDSVIAMAKSTFDRLAIQTQVGGGLVSELVDGDTEMSVDLQGEALMHKTYAARLMGGEASAPAATASVLRFMVDLAKMCPPFSAACRRAEFIESCVDLYFSCVRSAHAVMIAKELSVKTEDKNINDGDDTSSSQNTFSSLPHEQEESVKTSISLTSFPPVQGSASSEDIPIATDNIDGNKTEITLDSQKLTEEVDQLSDNKHFNFHDLKISPVNVHPTGSPGSPSLSIYDSPILSERSNSNSRFQSVPSPSPSQILGFPSWLGSAASPSMESSVSLSFTEFESTPDLNLNPNPSSQIPTNSFSAVNPKLLLDVDESGYGGGPCFVAANAILDFMVEVLADFVTEHIKATPVIETILETVPLYVDSESVLVFQGLCLTRLMNFLERRLQRDDEEDEKKLDKNRWSLNLDALCYLIVDRVYMGAFPQPAAVLKTLEFLLSMLQLANKDGRVEQAPPTGKGILSIGRGTKQIDSYVISVFKNMNRVTMYCFLPTFLISIGEDEFLSRLGLQIEPRKKLFTNSSQEDGVIDVCTVLQLLVAHSRLIFCPSNPDTELTCCLCINMISLLHDQRPNARNLAVDILKHLLVHRRAALEDLLVSKPNQGPVLDVLHGGFDLLLTGRLTTFFDWLKVSELIVNRTLEQCAAIMWVQYVAGSVKFPGVRIKGMDSRRKREIGRKARDSMKLDQRHWEQVNERRIALELVRDAMSTELRVVRQDKYGWVLHAESEWQTHVQQLIHEQGIFSLPRSSGSTDEPEWQLCPIEGPFRMRKKLERCKLKVDTVQHILSGKFESEKEKTENGDSSSDSNSDSGPSPDRFVKLLLNDDAKQESFDDEMYDGSIFKDADGVKVGWNNNIDRDIDSSINDESLHSAAEFSMKSSSATAPLSESVQQSSVLSSPKKSSSTRLDEIRATEDNKLDKELSNNGEYLIRPYLLPAEKIKFKYNCERVVGLDKHDGIFLIGELCLYVIENFYIDESDCICEKECEDELSVIDQALGVTKDFSMSSDSQSKMTSSWGMTVKPHSGGRAWAYNGGAWGKEKVTNSGNIPHLWRMWKLSSVHEILKRDYQLRPVAVEIFSMDGCNDLLVFHKKEREEVFKNLVAMNLPRNSMLDTTISGSVKQESAFKIMAKSFSKRWQNGEISNFQYLMHLNTLAGRGYSDLTQYPVFPWVLADYESENLDLTDENSFRKLDKPMGCQTEEGEDEFKKRYESWDDPEIPKFHYGSHYSSAGIVLFYLLRLPPFSTENQKLQGGQFDHADRLFNSVRDTWSSAAGRGNTSDVKELIPEFFYMPEFLENRFDLDLGEKQSGEKVGDVGLPPWAKGSAREFIRKHREALESDYVSENLHHWIDLIFGYKQRGKAAEEATNVFYHYTYEGNVDIDAVTDPALKASILAQINHFGQTPKQLFQRAHPKRKKDKKPLINPLKYSSFLVPHEIRKSASPIAQIATLNDKILIVGPNNLLKPRTYATYVAWGFPDRSLRYMSYDQDKLLSTHENLHGGNQIQCASASHDGHVLVTGADDGLVCVWRVGSSSGSRAPRTLQLEKALSAHSGTITCLHICQPYMVIISGSDDCTVVLWDLSSLGFIRQLPVFPSPVSAIYMNELTGEIVTAAGIMLAVWSINGDCLSVVNTSQLPSDFIVSVTTCTFSDWLETNWYVSGHQSGAVKVWQMVHNSSESVQTPTQAQTQTFGLGLGGQVAEYTLVLRKVLRGHKHPVTSLHLTSDLKQLLSGDSDGHLISWTLPDETLRNSIKRG
ncbi:putative transcription factor WD40-like family [Helianthus annuus]|uniref:Putative beige/BEACH/WD domain containing protein n=1 Tax=Helianthus annuus TaxID=4232 RepID=A0A251VMK3_HELAN|nr:protein SPIRRIG [Helianthus annuus]XP_035834109.1 protein SPIRRIG [Helianthus annuus]KAF5820568.1 putative transcription factor WD40-like family [Helianthus annuus]